MTVFIGALMPVVVNTQAGIANVQREYLDVGTIFNANKRQMLFEIAIPSALDAIFAGIRNSTSAAWMVVLAAEMLALSDDGLKEQLRAMKDSMREGVEKKDAALQEKLKEL